MIARGLVALGLALGLPLVGAGGSAATVTAMESDAGDAREEIVLVGTLQGIPLRDLIAIAGDATGTPFLYDPDDVEGLDGNVTFLGTIRVARERFLEFFELVLRIEDFVVVDETIGSREIRKIVRLGQQARGRQALKTDARIVGAAELERLKGRSCLVTTEFTFEHLAGESVDHLLCVYCSDSTYQSVRRIPGTRTLVITGVAREVAALLAMARRLDLEFGRQGFRELHVDLEERVTALEKRVAEIGVGRR